MKKVFLLPPFIFGALLVSIFYFGACSQQHKTDIKPELVKNKQEVLQEPTSLENGVQLPAGTRWAYTDQTQSAIEFILPEGYKFLLYDAANNTFRMASRTTGYACSCTGGKGNCVVVYDEELGFGFLRGTCEGTCIGTPASRLNTTIEGVLYVENDWVASETPQKASLTALGKEGIFTLPEFVEEIKEAYELLYGEKKVDFNNIPQNGEYVLVKAYLYGCEIALVLPNDENLRTEMPNLELLELREGKEPICTCSGGAGSCKLKKVNIEGYAIYHCTTCTMKF